MGDQEADTKRLCLESSPVFCAATAVRISAPSRRGSGGPREMRLRIGLRPLNVALQKWLRRGSSPLVPLPATRTGAVAGVVLGREPVLYAGGGESHQQHRVRHGVSVMKDRPANALASANTRCRSHQPQLPSSRRQRPVQQMKRIHRSSPIDRPRPSASRVSGQPAADYLCKHEPMNGQKLSRYAVTPRVSGSTDSSTRRFKRS